MLALQLAAADRNAALVGFSKFIRIFVQILILGAGASLVINGQLTSGAMIAASILLGRALAPVEQAIGAWKGMVAARDAYDRLKRLLERVPAEEGAMPLPAPKGNLSCEQVVYVPARTRQAGAQRRHVHPGAGRDPRCRRTERRRQVDALQDSRRIVAADPWPCPAGRGGLVRLAGGATRPLHRLSAPGRRAVRRHGEGQHRPARRRNPIRRLLSRRRS